MSDRINYDGRRFRMSSTSTGDTAAINGTIFEYQQDGDMVTCVYRGGSVREGRMIGLVDGDSNLTIRFTHIYTDGRMMSGHGHSQPEILPDGRIKLHETFTVFDNDHSGTSTVEEIRP